ncbi:hypothetical protein PPERSA_02499 [Pseudocohnilembus persalinus]|uniref:Radical SAM core domain-containing protein n=1 Tax=Pseudocohnilembus persalinus TaxID=266149 RepID=A0A0V0QB46_PSEPJ|nr:hypothetical protein PPERSA_02499 [Pseudocohnilembus persalinus]|eukprot:KRW99387.1 hypothetical protein PPERSA_02499 [Pseudocohnilembus persalinus]
MKQIFTRLKSHNYLKYQKSIQNISEKYQVECFQKLNPPKVPGNYLGIINKGIENLYKENSLLAVSPSVYDIENQDEKLSVISCLQSFEKMYHVTVLSNFSIGFDKYSMTYSKENLEKSTFKNQFYLLTEDELEIGYQKSDKLLKKLNLKDNQRIILCTTSDYIQKSKNKLQKNQNTGLGYYIDDNKIKISELYVVDDNGKMKPISVEDAYALSMKINQKKLYSYQDLVPRTISILPVAQGCQAKCPFCFSHTSVSKDVKQKILNKHIIEATLQYAKQRGAERAVITGGGEPTMLPFHYIIKLIKQCKKHFDRVIMITNGYNLGHIEQEQERKAALQALDEAGLNILAVSRHDIKTKKLMNLETKSHKIARSLQGMQFLRNLQLRWVCVIQKGGVQDEESLVRYLDDVVETGGCDQINFKELYVASSQESVYYEEEGNEFCRKNQVSLSLITEFLDKNNAKVLKAREFVGLGI